MSKDNKLNNDTLESKLTDLLLLHQKKDSEFFLSFYGIKFNRLISTRNFKEEEEPPKFFKKKHKAWEDEMKELDEQITDTLKKMDLETDDIIEIEELLKKDTKKEAQQLS